MIYLFILLILMTSCVNEEKILTAEATSLSCEIHISKFHGDILKINDDKDTLEIDISGLNPWKVQFANIDGGDVELILGVYKKSPHHDEMAKRLFIYNVDFENKRLKPKVRISRLSNPLVDFIMYDIDGDGFDEIVSIERDIDGKFNLNGYDYANSFVFEKNYVSKKLETEPEFIDEFGNIKIKNEEHEMYLEKGEIKWQRKNI